MIFNQTYVERKCSWNGGTFKVVDEKFTFMNPNDIMLALFQKV